MENALTFNIGDETRPKVEDLADPENYIKSFFFDIYKKAFELINEILTDNIQDSDKQKGFQKERNNIIAFMGGRGTGKTSCMQSIYQSLEEDTGNNKFIHCSHNHFLTLPTIDPTYFEEKSNILEIIIARMFHHFKEHAAMPNASRGRDSTIYLEYKNDLARKFQKVKDSLDTINSKTNYSNDSIEELSNLAGGINLHENMVELIHSFLRYTGKKYLAIAIDDIDLQTRYAYKMVEQVRKYLIIPNVIILMGVKLIQLTDLIKQTYYQEYKDLIDKDSLSDTVENMTGRYLSKLIPYNHRIFLPEVETKFNQKFIIFKENKHIHTFDSIKYGVLQLIYIKTRYIFYDSDIKSSLIIPRNLRDLLNIISLLFYMDEIPQKPEKDKLTTLEKQDEIQKKYENDKRKIIYKNRIIFKNYFIDTWCCEHLPSDMFAFIRELSTLEASSINKRIIDFLYKKSEGKIRHDERVTYRSNRSYNISLSDVDYFLDKISNNFEIPYINYFVFALKTIYSMFLYELFEDKQEDITFRKNILKERFGMSNINRKGSEILKRINKLMLFSNYEKILGGNFLRVADLYPKDGINNYITKYYHYIHIRRIDQSLLNKLYLYAINPQEVLQINTTTYIISKNLAFNIWEFFMLTIYIRSSNPYFRSQKRCYYDTFPLPLSTSTEDYTIYSSTAILFNIVKYYNHFRLYYSLNLERDYPKDNPFIEFWNIIESKKNDSIIYKLLHENSLDTPAFPQTSYIGNSLGFKNKSLENIFIRNIEILDNLQDYLPYLKSTIKPQNNKDTNSFIRDNLEILINFYTKLYKFEFYLYPKELNKDYNITQLKRSFTSLYPLAELLLKIKKDISAKSIFWKIYYNESDINLK